MDPPPNSDLFRFASSEFPELRLHIYLIPVCTVYFSPFFTFPLRGTERGLKFEVLFLLRVRKEETKKKKGQTEGDPYGGDP